MKNFLIGFVVLAAVTGGAAGLGIVGSQRAAAVSLPAPTIMAAQCNKGGFFGMKPWYHYLPDSEIGMKQQGTAPTDPCGIKCFNIFTQAQTNPNICGETASDVPGVVLAVVDDLLRIAGLVAVAFVLKGSFEYVGSRGNAERTAQAQSTIIAALTGLAVSLVAVGFVAFLGSRLH